MRNPSFNPIMFAFLFCLFIGFFFWFVQEDEIGLSPVLAPKQKDVPKEEPADNSPIKSTPSASARGTPPTSKSAKGKRKSNGDDVKTTNGGPPKKVKTENVSLCLL